MALIHRSTFVMTREQLRIEALNFQPFYKRASSLCIRSLYSQRGILGGLLYIKCQKVLLHWPDELRLTVCLASLRYLVLCCSHTELRWPHALACNTDAFLPKIISVRNDNMIRS